MFRSNYDPNVTHLGRGESYRPGGGGAAPPYRPSPGRERGAREQWLSDRRESERREDVDSYVPDNSRRTERPHSRSPRGYRRRSRSPPFRGSNGPRSPRRFSPRRGERMRSPQRRRSRSPFGNPPPSPGMKWARDNPPPYTRRSPSSTQRERPSSPYDRRVGRPRSPARKAYVLHSRDATRGGYRTRSRTPPRRDGRKGMYDEDSWKRRSPSPKAAQSGYASGATSRRSSPPLHPDRVGLTGLRPRSPIQVNTRPFDPRPPRPYSQAESPSERERSQPIAQPSPRSYVDRTRVPTSPRKEHENDEPRPPIQPPTRPSSYRNGNYGRVPPSGPARNYTEAPRLSPPVGPSSTSYSMSAHNRPNPSILAAPTRPRGAPTNRFEGPPRDFGPPPARGRYRGAPLRSASYDARDGHHAGARGDFARGGHGRGDSGYSRLESNYGRGDSVHSSQRANFGRDDKPPSFRMHSNNNSSMTYPRTQRFNTTSQYLVGGEKISPGGKLAPSELPLDQEKRMKQLEEAAEKIREEIEEKQRLKRDALREWEVRQRESEREGLRSELAERHLEKLTEGEDGAGAAF